MDSQYYAATTYWVLAVNLAAAVGNLSLMRLGKAASSAMTITALISVGWILFLHWAFGIHRIVPADFLGASFYGVILLAVIVFIGAHFFTVRDVYFNLPQEYIQLWQGLRVFIGGGFLMEGSLDVIPSWFGVMDGFLHISSGFFALVAAVAVVKNAPFKTALLWLANIVGVMDVLIIATSICFVVWNDLGANHNMYYIVFYTAGVILWLHFVSISKLISEKE